MSRFAAAKAKRVLAALLRLSWEVRTSVGLAPDALPARMADITFAFHDDQEIGPIMLSKIARRTGLKPEDL